MGRAKEQQEGQIEDQGLSTAGSCSQFWAQKGQGWEWGPELAKAEAVRETRPTRAVISGEEHRLCGTETWWGVQGK